MSSSKQQETNNTEQTQQQMETQQQYDNQEEVEIDERSLKCNAFIIEYILYKKVDYLVEDLLRELPYDRDNVNLRTRLIISQLNGLWEEVEQEDKVDGDRIGFIVSSVTALLGLLDERKQTFAEFFQEATFSADAYSKKIKKWLTSFINADTYELKYQSLEALVKYFNILGNYLGEPKLYSLLNQPKQIQEETQSNDAVMNEPQIPQITVDSLPDEPCTYLGLKNTGISTSEETTIFITERLFNARKPSKPIPQVPEKAPRQEELTQQPTQQVVAASTQSNQDEQAKKRKPTANANNLKKKSYKDQDLNQIQMVNPRRNLFLRILPVVKKKLNEFFSSHVKNQKIPSKRKYFGLMMKLTPYLKVSRCMELSGQEF
ncbi:predicted protein [Naegleria gruberi]|uniref:Predicted protein n=1 Tax=Naegleria gruberi TaxID=5762 RepID=D2VQD3_NAEGR|nr:uncharacterized protein NAEGRDRAFT_58923 [Naegleria gruberi]EFC40853.1 predicted protein [Naegleria gruberi]|eukprot:XP_002673597.1 predicted protein [Naegleria gruberi strain NEG-M]